MARNLENDHSAREEAGRLLKQGPKTDSKDLLSDETGYGNGKKDMDMARHVLRMDHHSHPHIALTWVSEVKGNGFERDRLAMGRVSVKSSG